ncbi:MAG: hypothetical protein IKW50_02025 [Oscillospiraceae bacterium]|nr:hypothetical protein [Oscillospiraceae bacterium]
MKFSKKICLIAGVALFGCSLICGCGAKKDPEPTVRVTVPVTTDTKHPSEYTWEEYMAMTEAEKQEFQKKFGSAEIFEAWKEAVMQQDTRPECPWDDPGAKQPADYTWEEFQALSPECQIIFQSDLGEEAFASWMDQAKSQPEEYPWDADGAKRPADYTWEEFEALSAEHQIAFQNALGAESFASWMDQAQSQPEEYPWDADGSKQPADYTWEEFEALSAEHQMAFQSALGEEGFGAWMDRIQSLHEGYPWDAPGAKQPADYTWEEFEALSGEHQIAFQNVLGMESFDAWLNRVNP